MASRYWVGGTATWNATVGTKWATTSGGAGGASVPTVTDDAFIDANSGAATITVGAAATANNLTCTGFTGVLDLAGQSTTWGGSWTLAASHTVTNQAGAVENFTATTSGQTLTTGGNNIGGVTINGVGAVYTLQDNLTCGATGNSALSVTNGSFIASNKTIACTMSSSSTNTRTLSLSGCTVNLGGTGTIWGTGVVTGLTFTAPSTINITNTSVTGKTFSGGGLTFNTLNIAAAGTGIVTIIGSNKYTNLLTTGTGAVPISVTSGTTQTITGGASSFIAGSAGNLPVITAVTASTPFTLFSPLVISTDYISLKDCTASGNYPFYAGINSTNVSGNTNWLFTASPTNTSAFFALF